MPSRKGWHFIPEGMALFFLTEAGKRGIIRKKGKEGILIEPIALLSEFRLPSEAVSCEPFGNGHINDTFRVGTASGEEFILQRINTSVFRDPTGLMENIRKVTVFLADEAKKRGGDPRRESMEVIPTKEGKLFFDDGKDCWRIYTMITDSYSLEKVESLSQFREVGEAFGAFLNQLGAFPADTLVETIPDFHHTPKRLEALERAIGTDRCGRVRETEREIAFVRERKEKVSLLTDAFAAGKIPLRVTHNDTKLNNILFDKKTKRPLCVVDLDTVMPGLSLCDFGDAIRSGAAACAEDEPDFRKAGVVLPLFAAYTEGYLRTAGEILTEDEIALLPEAAEIITLETGIRFLTDYLMGDTYFKTSRKGQNLDRARTQFAMAADIEKKNREMHGMIPALLPEGKKGIFQ